jgi:putative ABC transport system permease protein
VVAAPRRSASLAAPILAISAIAGSMVLSLSFAADSAEAGIRDALRAPIVVRGSADLTAVPGVTAVDAGIPLQLIRINSDDAELEEAEGIDPAVATRTRDLTAVSGDISRLTGNTVAVSKEMAGFDGYQVGDEIPVIFTDRSAAKLRIVAVVKNAQGVNPSILIPLDLARKHAPTAQPERIFVDGADLATLNEHLSGTTAHAVPAAEWEAEQAKGVREGNRLGLILLLGPAALYSAIAIANTLLMGSLQRRHEFITSRLLGATPAQIRRMVLWESSLVGAVALSLGTAITLTVGILIRHAMTSGMTDVPMTVPWAVLTGIAGICLTLAVGSALAPTTYILRRSQPSAAVD